MAMRLSFGTASFGAVVVMTMFACAKGNVADVSGGDVAADDAGVTNDDGGTFSTYDSGVVTADAGGDGSAAQDAGVSGDSGGALADASPGADASPAPPPDASAQDSAPPPDSGPACSIPSGNPCSLTPNCGCAANQKCDVAPSNASVDVCVNTTTSGTQGASCGQYPDCAAGFACICTAQDFFGNCTSTQCQAWCEINGANICTGGTSCKTLGSNIAIGGKTYGTCQ